jgi:hypothetical protein
MPQPTFSQTASAPRRWTQVAVLAASLLAISPVALSVSGCSSSSATGNDAGKSDSGAKDAGKPSDAKASHDTGKPAFCDGGFIRKVDGGTPTCEGLCKPSLCTNANNVCVGNDCALQCNADLDCQPGQSCLPAKEDGTGTAVATCQASGKGALGTLCPNGNECSTLMTCGDGTPCPDSGTCKVGTCQALQCLSSGVGDETAYCTKLDCHGTTDCPGGFWCEQIRTSSAICGQPIPNLEICGASGGTCVDAGTDAAGGTTYTSGALCSERNACTVRRQCVACSTDLDCSLVRGQTCVAGSCAESCVSDGDCVDGFKCTSGSCLPRSGSCSGATGQGIVCSPCRIDAECGPGMICGAFETGGQHTCLLVGLPSLTCTVDSDCPLSASGAHVTCLGEAEQLQRGQAGYHTCGAAPFSVAANSYDCWPENPGGACYYGTDCASGNCLNPQFIPPFDAGAEAGPDAGGAQPYVPGSCQ